ncbi:hypothetical protein SAMN05216391_11448 [Lachnospiraceae bacterium KHCPX20]|nr:hypothetical protein SAMN05216391_11448 [Lachnospiraceae bacterium KHCPX20]
MNEKYMRFKKLILPTLTVVMIASMIQGCAATSSKGMLNMTDNSKSIELTISEPKSIENGEDEAFDWVELGSLDDAETLRSAWDKVLGTSGSVGNKQGTLYATPDGKNDNNNTLHVVLHNNAFYRTLSDTSSDTYKKLAEAATNQYKDLISEDTETQMMMGINGYFNILQDSSDQSYSNPYKTLTRAEVMAALTRATTPVSTNLDSSKEFNAAVGDSKYNKYAESLDKTAFISTKDGSLNSDTYNSNISRAEAIYMLVNTYYSEEFKNMNVEEAEANFKFDDAKDAGNLADKIGVKSGDKMASAKILKHMLDNSSEGLDTKLYKSLLFAHEMGMVTSETNWNQSITKAEFIGMITDILSGDSSVEVFDSAATKSLTMAEFKKKYPAGSKIKEPDGYLTIMGYDGDDVIIKLPDGTLGCQTGPLEVLDEQQLKECAEEQKKADKAYKEGKYPDNEIGHQRAMDKYREVTKAYIDGKIDKQPKNTDYDNEYSTGINDDTLTVRRTTKGYACIVFEGMVIYESMVMPDGSFEFTDSNVTGTSQALMKWCDDRGIADYYGLSYKQLQKIFGKLDKNSKSMTLKEFYK